MSDDYLWNKSGPPDPEIERLEQVMAKLRLDRPAPFVPPADHFDSPVPPARFSQRWLWPRIGVVFATILIATAIGTLWRWKTAVASGWNVVRIAGVPRVGNSAIRILGARVGLGEALETDAQSRAEIQFPEVGRIQIDPDTRLKVLRSPSGGSRLALEHGTIHARIWALPGIFVVDTPSARAVDLGCAYTLHVDDSGDGLIRTSMGWVGFKFGEHEAFIPAGAACKTRMKNGPGTPYFEEASAGLRAALEIFDSPTTTHDHRAASLQTVLVQSRKQDSLTLWHLLSRVDDSERGQVFDRLAGFIPPPAGVTRDGIQHLDRAMLDRWWDALDLGDIWLWRHWERSWSEDKISQR
jgi:hypothetical protein